MSTETDAAPAEPLDGVLVADFSRMLAGPYATMLLGDLGATVVKVEGPHGDDTPQWGPPWTEAGESTYYLSVNRNKRSLVLDLTDDTDRRRAEELVRRADIMFANLHRRACDVSDSTTPRSRRPTPGSSTARSPASAAPEGRRCPATTWWCRRSPG